MSNSSSSEIRKPYLFRKPYLLMFAVALAVRLAVIPFLYTDWTDPFVLDHWAFGLIARSIASGHGFGSPFAPNGSASALLPPVYSYLLAGVFKVFGIETKSSVIAALSLSSLFSALTCVPVYLISERAFGIRVAKWAGWGWAFSPYGIYYSADWAWSTPLVTLELAWLFYFACRIEDSSRKRDWLAYGGLCGIAALTEPVVLAVLPLLGLWGFYQLYRHHRPWKGPAVAAALAGIIVLSPWIGRNYLLFHRFIPVRSGLGLELYIGNNGYSERWVNSSLHPNHSDAELQEYQQNGEMAYMDHKMQQAKTYIHAHPGWFVWMTGRRILYMWTGYWSFDKKYLQQEPLDPPNIFVDTTMTILALVGLWRVFKINHSLAVRFAIVLLFYPLSYYFSHPETYYFRPVDPLIVILAAVTIAWRSQTESRKAPAIAASSERGVTSN